MPQTIARDTALIVGYSVLAAAIGPAALGVVAAHYLIDKANRKRNGCK